MPNLLAADLDHILQHTAGVWEELRGSRIFISPFSPPQMDPYGTRDKRTVAGRTGRE